MLWRQSQRVTQSDQIVHNLRAKKQLMVEFYVVRKRRSTEALEL